MKEVFIIEDHAPDADVATILIHTLKGEFAISYGRDGQEVLRTLKKPEYIPDIILLDLNIPKFNGLEVLRLIKQTPQLQKAKVVIVSGNDDTSYVESCLQLNADGYIIKTPQLERMKKQLAYHLE